MTGGNKLLSPEEVAERLSVSPVTIRSWLRSGELKGLKLAGNIWRVKPEEVEAFINKAEAEAAKEEKTPQG